MSPLQSFPPEAGRTTRGMFPEYFLPTIRDQPGLLGWFCNMHNCDHLSCAPKIKIKLNWVAISWCMCPLTRNSFGFIKKKNLNQPGTSTWWQCRKEEQLYTSQSAMPKLFHIVFDSCSLHILSLLVLLWPLVMVSCFSQ